MSRTSTITGEVGMQIEIDDLKRIHNIGVGIERRLHNAGIHTYAQFAALTPHGIASIIGNAGGISAERIAEQKWIEQARTLAAQSSQANQMDELLLIEPPSEGQKTKSPNVPQAASKEFEAPPRPRSEIFTVQLELRPDGIVRRTMAQHARTERGDEKPEQWSGWDAARLVAFIEQRAMLQHAPEAPKMMLANTPTEITQTLPSIHIEEGNASQFDAHVEDLAATSAPAGMGDSRPSTSTPAPPELAAALSGVLHISGLETAAVGKEGAHNVLRTGEQLLVRLTLDLTKVVAPPDGLISYKAAVYAKQLDGPRRVTLAEGTGNIKMAGSAQVELTGQGLPSGLYRLTAVATLYTTNSPERPQLAAFLESGLIEILNGA